MNIKLVIVVKTHFAIPDIKLALVNEAGEFIQQGATGNFMPPPPEMYEQDRNIAHAFFWESADAAIRWATKAGLQVTSDIVMTFKGGRMYFKGMVLTTDPTDLLNIIQARIVQLPETTLPRGKEVEFKLFLKTAPITYRISRATLTNNCTLELK